MHAQPSKMPQIPAGIFLPAPAANELSFMTKQGAANPARVEGFTG